MPGTRAYKLAAVLGGVVLLLMIGCTPGSSGSSNTSNTSTVISDPTGDPGNDPIGGDPGTDPPGDGSPASIPEPATGLLFLCAAGSVALARLRARKRA
jgi:hypothetical protein